MLSSMENWIEMCDNSNLSKMKVSNNLDMINVSTKVTYLPLYVDLLL